MGRGRYRLSFKGFAEKEYSEAERRRELAERPRERFGSRGEFVYGK